MSKLKSFLSQLKQRKFLVISISFHIIVITAVIIMLPLWKEKKSEPIKIQEIEIFTPQPPQPEEPLKKEAPSEEEKKVEEKETEPEKPLIEQKTIKRPPPPPLKSNLENNILKQWDDLEKKK